jgi:hypothetical protein
MKRTKKTTQVSMFEAPVAEAVKSAPVARDLTAEAERLLANFEVLAEAPGGVKRLREVVLALAVSGRLVKQDSRDGGAALMQGQSNDSASFSIAKLKKSRKQTVEEPIEDNLSQYVIPIGWNWVPLGHLAHIKTGKLDANASSPNGRYPFFTCAREPLRIDNYAYDGECVLVAGNGNFDVNYYHGKFEAYQRTYIIEAIDRQIIDGRYIYRFMQLYADTLRKMSIGGVISYIKIGFLTDAPFPLAPLAEQKRIVAKVDELMKLCDELEARQAKERETRARLTKAALDALANAEGAGGRGCELAAGGGEFRGADFTRRGCEEGAGDGAFIGGEREVDETG